MWIDDDIHGGHYVVEASVHYFAPGLWFALVEDLASSGFPVVGDVTYGEREGLDHAMTCQFVSRWADPDHPAGGFTIYADVDLAGPLGAG